VEASDRAARDDLRVVFILRDFGASFEALLNAVAPVTGLNRTDLRALDLIVAGNGLTAGELSHRLNVTTGAITALLDRLERSGHAARRVQDGDRRRVSIWPTAKAVRDRDSTIAALADAVLGIVDRYTEDEGRVIERFLGEMAAAMFQRTAELRSVKSSGPAPTSGLAPDS
jgi:DNA-binding MarR family transcriptional regulator